LGATALVFTRHPDLHEMVCGNKLFNPAEADAPLMIIANANYNIEIARVPLSFLRRVLMRILFRSERFRRNGCGTFQVTMLSAADRASSLVFSSAAVLLAGRVREKPVVLQRSPGCQSNGDAHLLRRSSRPGRTIRAAFLIAVREVLESDVLQAEISVRP
jgi:hypothetical protein